MPLPLSSVVSFHVRRAACRGAAIVVLGAALTVSRADAQQGKSPTSGTTTPTGTTTGTASGARVRAKAALAAAAAAEASRRPTGANSAEAKPAAAKPAAARTSAARPRAAKAAAAPRKLTARERVGAELRSIASRARAAMVVQDTATLARLWSEDYIYTSLSGETYSKAERLESVMSPAFVVDEAPDVLPSEMDVVRLYGDVAVVHSRLAPAATTRSGARGGRARLLTVWARERGTWRVVAAQATGVGVPEAVPAKRKK